MLQPHRTSRIVTIYQGIVVEEEVQRLVSLEHYYLLKIQELRRQHCQTEVEINFVELVEVMDESDLLVYQAHELVAC